MTRKWNLPLTYEPKIAGVCDGTIQQTKAGIQEGYTAILCPGECMKRCKDCGAEIVSGRCCPACRKIRGDPQLMTYRKHGEEVRAYLETEIWPEYVYPDKVIKTNKNLFNVHKFTERGRRLILCRCLLELGYKKESIGFAHVFRKKD